MLNLLHLLLIGVPDGAALSRVDAKLHRLQIPAARFTEPDSEIGLTAIATAPLSREQREPLANYCLWCYSPCVEQSAAAFNGEGRANLPS